MTYEEIQSTVAAVQFRKYRFHVWPLKQAGFYILVANFDALCVTTGKVELQTTREWLIVEKTSRSEVVATVLKCVLTSEEHEAREDFIYHGQRIFGPHFDVDQLHALAFSKNPPTEPKTS